MPEISAEDKRHAAALQWKQEQAEKDIDKLVVKGFFFKSPGMGNHSYIVTGRKGNKVIIYRDDKKVSEVDIGVVIRTVILAKVGK